MKPSLDLKLLSKAETLERISPLLQHGQVLPLLLFTFEEWLKDPDLKLKQLHEWHKITSQLPELPIVPGKVLVRSSCLLEDTKTSNAGKYLTLQNVLANKADLKNAIAQVFASYGPKIDDKDQVFIQPQLSGISLGFKFSTSHHTDIQFSGVLLTRDLSSFSPYDVISYDTSSVSANAVTSGSGVVKTLYRYKASDRPFVHKEFVGLISMARELEEILGIDHLDIEFAICQSKEQTPMVFLLQVRTLAKSSPHQTQLNIEDLDEMTHLFRKLSAQFPHNKLLGDFTMFSTMVDWNPAEIIGREPRTLARSLYQNAITDLIWAQQRKDYGYRDVTGFPLLTSFHGIPYVDVRVDFNSWIPASLNDTLAEKLVNFYLQKLRAHPELHDKVEFHILFANFYPGIHARLVTDLQTQNKTQISFSDQELKEIEQALYSATHWLFETSDHDTFSIITKENQKIEDLEKRRASVLASNLTKEQKIYQLMEDLRNNGTLPFAGLARCGFIAVQFLRSFQQLGAMTAAESEAFMGSLSTITKQLAKDVKKLADGQLSRETFLHTYGHLRPGTYDVLSLRYDEAFDLYFSDIKDIKMDHPMPSSPYSAETLTKIAEIMHQNGMSLPPETVLQFIKEAIEGRENSKFMFTRCLSDILVLITQLGEDYGLSRDDVSFLDITSILRHSSEQPQNLKKESAQNRLKYATTRSVILPSVITSEDQFYEFEEPPSTPNFITDNRVLGKVMRVASDCHTPPQDLQGSIICIRSADPGYDWLFTHNIGGLVTEYGGINSHMSIRCAELGLPAVIGSGQSNFNRWESAQILEIDCSNKKVTIVS